MKVVQANKAYLPHIGGVETVVRQVAEGILDHGRLSHVVACSDDGQTRQEQHNGVDVTYVRTMARVKSLPISPAYTAHLMRHRADILTAHEPFLLSGVAYLARRQQARRQFKRLVVWWHSDIVRQKALWLAYAPLQHALLREADAIVVATPNHITSSVFLGPYAHKCHVIPFGIDPERFHLHGAAQERVCRLRAQYGKPIVLFSGRLVYYKGAEYLVQAMRAVPEAHLVVVGSGPVLPQLEEIAAAGAGNVTFIPYLSEPEFVAMYHAADVFVLPSVENSEAFGIVQIEAMACATPVISSDLQTGVTYVNRDGETGLVVPRRDADALACAIRKLLMDPELRQRLGATARERVLREFTVKRMVDQVVALYDDLIAAPYAVVRAQKGRDGDAETAELSTPSAQHLNA